MPLDYPPELICSAYCNNLECEKKIRIACQHGDRQADVEEKLRDYNWIVEGESVFCSENCRIRFGAWTSLVPARR